MRDCSELSSEIEEILPLVERPSRYMGRELSAVSEGWEKSSVRFALAYPDSYEVGIAHLGLHILYNILNDHPEYRAERVYSPRQDMARQLRDRDLPLFSLESRRPIKDFDFLGITLQSELTYTNILELFSLAKMSFRSENRSESSPFVVAGGPCAFNVEPLAPFVDMVVLGDGEEVIVEIADTYNDWVLDGRPDGRKGFFLRAAKLEGIYIPHFYEPIYQDGDFSDIKKHFDVPGQVKKRVLKDLDDGKFPTEPVVPYVQAVHDRAVVELFRGCTRGCRFCLPGMVNRPVRERSSESICELTRELIRCTGYQEVSLTSLSSTDYSEIEEVVEGITDDFYQPATSVSLPSLRADEVSVRVADKIREVRNAGLTIAPEAGTQRLRDVLNKGITEKDYRQALERAFKAGCDNLKLYFMLGLPTETEDDVVAISDMVQSAQNLFSANGTSKRNLRISVSVALFIPKPHTPFQWEPQLSEEEFTRRVKILRQRLPDNKVELAWTDPELGRVEAALTRGDRRMAQVIELAWENGARFDGWSEIFRFSAWQEAFESADIDPHYYANRRRTEDEAFPWDHLDAGISSRFLLEEKKRAYEGLKTPDCRWKQCSGCGVCARLNSQHRLSCDVGDESDC